MNKINKVINYFRNLREEGVPTNNISSGNISKFDPVMTFKRRKNGNIDGRSVSDQYKKWLRSLGHLN